MEIWKQVRDYPMYEVSSFGRVRKNYLNGKTKILKSDVINGGYLRVSLCKDGKVERFIVHVLVAQHFIDNPNEYPHINHIDNDVTNNRVDNLEWCTPLMNAQHRDKQDRHTPCKKVYQYDQEFNLINVFRSTREAARQTGFPKTCIPNWCVGKARPKNNYIWRYEPIY